LLFFAACRQEIARGEERGPTSFRLEPAQGDQFGEIGDPLPFSSAMAFTFDISALDHDGEVATWFDGDVRIAVNPVGDLASGQPEWITLQNGRVDDVQIQIAGVHGQAAIWVEDIGTPDEPGSYATGASPKLLVGNPTIRNLQETDNHRVSPLAGDYVTLDVEDRDVVVTAVTNDGFYASDKGDPEWGGVFVFTHSRARGVDVGDRVTNLSGTAEDFYGFTELGFPSWLTKGTSELPPPALLSAATVADDAAMEPYEGGLVEVRDVTVCQPGTDFATFGQWVVLLDANGNCDSGEGAITIVSAFTVDWFDPYEHVGEAVVRITGNLRYHSSATPTWLLLPRGNDDMQLP
jgi:hypothetical protein